MGTTGVRRLCDVEAILASRHAWARVLLRLEHWNEPNKRFKFDDTVQHWYMAMGVDLLVSLCPSLISWETLNPFLSGLARHGQLTRVAAGLGRSRS